MAKKQKAPVLQNVILISDPLSDVDDLFSFMLAKELDKQGFFKLKAVVTTVGDFVTRLRRAKFAKGFFIKLGLPFLKVGAGGEYSEGEMLEHNASFFPNSETVKIEVLGQSVERNMLKSLQTLLPLVEDKSLSFVINAQMYDVYNFLRNISDKNLKKINKLVIMAAPCAELDVDGNFIPDRSSYNNAVCMSAAENLYRLAQEKDIRLVFVPKDAAYQVQFGKDFFASFEKLENEIAKCVAPCHQQFFAKLWEAVKNGEYAHFDVKRFAKVFAGDESALCGGENFEEMWEKVQFFNLYDALSVLAAADNVFKQFGHFERLSETRKVFVAHVDDAQGLREKVLELCLASLS